LWEIARPTQAKHTILRKYLDAWLPILGGGKYAHEHVVMIDGFAGPGRYLGGEPGSPLIMLSAYLEHSAKLDASPHFYFIEEDGARCAHLRDELARLELASSIEIEVIEGSFPVEFPGLVQRLTQRFGGLPPTFAFIDPFGVEEIPSALSVPLLRFPRCELLIYFPVSFIARFVSTLEFAPTLSALYSGDSWLAARDEPDFEKRKELLHDLFLAELRKQVTFVRSFEITPAHEAGGNTYYLFFGTGSELGLQRMKDAMWKVDPEAGQAFRDSTLHDHPVLFEQQPELGRLLDLLRGRFKNAWFTIEEAQKFTLVETPFRDNGHLKPILKAAEKAGTIEVQRAPGKHAGTFATGARCRFL
jgi:three-Cys-motif partner protein